MLLCNLMKDMWKVARKSSEVKMEMEDVYMKQTGVYQLFYSALFNGDDDNLQESVAMGGEPGRRVGTRSLQNL